ncbi:hypothetical protein FOCC_FOCC006381 [Frankliniella occidentalis]|uniref:Protein O-glucosyltransferase 2-like isoform X1 n=2 Tax=Frankliniella occidentalis TaxID=133901 RepID=A0A6J1S9F3_FRAOC|nr:protein O-glucosyltransferase 2-like isoform X1 [Frankliniella occidentalis]KAE8746961.1 hypothetical protein FOCC_FOCC006381 [Frankliniella occidentalis]
MVPLFTCSISLLTLLLGYVSSTDVDPSLSRAWGPGLHPESIVLPARYFFIQAVDKNNISLHTSPGDVFKVKILGKSPDRASRASWIQVMDRKDGSFIVRYKLYNTMEDLEIHVQFNDRHLSGSPFKTKGYSYAEECSCPRSSLNQWLEVVECPKYDQIDRDLKIFKRVQFSKLYPVIMQRFNQPESMSVCNYIIKENKIYRRCFGKHVGFKMFVDAILLSMSRKLYLPDMEFFFNLGDWPLSPSAGRPLIPLFSWCGSDDTVDIHVPTYDITESSLQCMGRVMLDMLSVQTNVELPWDERVTKAFWRGRDSRRERLHLVSLSREHPDLLNASLTNFFFFRNEEETYGPKEKHISFFKFFDYKYQVNVDGTVAAFRFPYLLGGGSMVIKQESKYHEHFYSLVRPWVHYVPVRHDLSDLVDRIHWAQDNDEKALKIALAGQKFAQENLLPLDVFCYHGRLFQEWAKRLVDPVEIRPEMELVSQPSESSKCVCESMLVKDEL